MTGMPDVISIEPNRKYTAHTTHSWDFLNLSSDPRANTLLQQGNYGEDIIIGVIDSGIWPESHSFDATGYGPPPKRWNGTCQTGDGFDARINCSNKIIGARWYSSDLSPEQMKGEYMSPRDYNGHGTHTASIAAGNIVSNRSFNGLAAGSVRGGAPRARLAIYKVLWGQPHATAGGDGASILKAIDHAINDGVDVMSLSIDGSSDYYFGIYHAVTKGITVVYAAGNTGPGPYTVNNDVPWVITVAASTVDRSFPTVITLGDNQKFVGQSISYNSEASKDNNFTELVLGQSCNNKTLSEMDVVGKIVICNGDPKNLRSNFGEEALNVINAGGRGLIYPKYIDNLLQPMPNDKFSYALVDFEIARKIFSYISSTSVPLAKISPAYTEGGQVLAPKVATFSSRGPNPTFPGILKPDIAAPGVNILAAVRGGYEFMSGTSMACPHVSGIVALLKSVHPDWSPSAIKSAIVTTAFTVNAYGVPIEAESFPRKLANPFDFGGGHIDPNKAADPGLVYDIDPIDYTKFFNCTLGSSKYCNSYTGELDQLNLPSIAIPDLKDTVFVTRTVTNVGPVNSVYKAYVEPPPNVNVFVEPDLISFDINKKVQTFKVTFVAKNKVQGDYTFGSLTWSDKLSHSVRIPIAVRTIIEDNYADVA